MEPTPLAKGKFALYQTPKGGMHLSLHVDGENEPRHIEIPAMMLKLMMRRGGMMVPESQLTPPVVVDAVFGAIPGEDESDGMD